MLFGPGGAVAGPQGLIIGNACWASPMYMDQDNAPTVVNNYGSGPIAGIIHREHQGLITQYLAWNGLLLPLGFGVTVFDGGDFWVLNSGAAFSLPISTPMKAYANFQNGSWSFAAPGAPSAGGTSTASTVTAQTFSATGGINGNVLTVTAVGTPPIYPGAVITSGGAGVVVAQLTSTRPDGGLGGIGTYALSVGEQTVAAGTTISGTWGLLTVGGTVTGNYGVGSVLSGGTVAVGTSITANAANTAYTGATPQLTGNGGAGTYAVSNNTAAVSAAINVAAVNTETNFYAASAGANGEIIKITSIPQGRVL